MKCVYLYLNKKTVLTYYSGLKTFPTTALSCVNASMDSSSNNIGCNMCTADELNRVNGCQRTSYDGLQIAYCSQVDDGNRPSVSSCYVGKFSTTECSTAAKITACSPSTEFCKVYNLNFPPTLFKTKN